MNNKALITTLVALLVVAAGAFWWLNNKPAASLDLYKYYPKATAFYLEVSPGEERTKQVLDFVEAQSSKHDGMEADLGAGPEAAMLESSMKEALSMNKQRQREQLHKLVENFNATFEPSFSIGAWQPDGKAVEPGEGEALLVFALREDMTLDAFAERFDMKMADFDKKEFKAGGDAVPYLVDKQEQFAYAIADQKFLVTNTETAMTQALNHHFKNEPNVYDDPLNKEYVDMLSAKREGTFLLNNRIYANSARQMREQFPGGSPVNESAMDAMIDAVPVTVGAIELDTRDQISVRFITPLMTESIEDGAFKDSLLSLYVDKQPLDDAARLPQNTAFFLAVVGVDNWYDFYTQHVLTGETMGQMRMADMMVRGAGLDLRHDLVGMFANKTVIAGRPQDQSMIVMLDKSDQKVEVLGKLKGIVQQFVQPQTDTIENVSVTMLPVPTGRTVMNLAYGEVDNAIVFAPSHEFAAAVKAGKGGANLSQDAIYKSLMRDIPKEGNFLLYLNAAEMPNPSSEERPFDALTVALWTEKKGQVELIQGQLNIKLVEATASK